MMHILMLIIALFTQYDFTIARLKYSGGGDWYSDPSSLPNLLEAINERTTIRAAPREENVEITDPKLFQYPYLYMTGHGKVRFSDEDVKILRKYFAAGGFLHADDNYGMDSTFRREIEKVFPDSPLIELPFDHDIYHSFYEFPAAVHEYLVDIHMHAAEPVVSVSQAGTGYPVENIVDGLPVVPDIQEWGKSPQVHQIGAEPQQV